jgi:predicted lipoprotein with Yx(FWY)xxD motif
MTRKVAVVASLSAGAVLMVSAAAFATPAKIVTRTSSSYGTYLAAKDGHAVYFFTADAKDKSACTADCAKAWPPVMTSGAPKAGRGVEASLLGTIPRNGGMQVTYDGKPLYYFVGDTSSKMAAGEGVNHFGGTWYLAAPNGKDIQKQAAKKGGGW